jgi:hypothetical protein
VKPTFLAQHGHDVINPKMPDEDFQEAVRNAQAEFDERPAMTNDSNSQFPSWLKRSLQSSPV